MPRRWVLALLPCVLLAAGSPQEALASPDDRAAQRIGRSDAERHRAAEIQVKRARRAQKVAREREAERRFRSLSLARGGIALAGFGVFGWGVWLRRRERPRRHHAVRMGLLCALAAGSYAGYYNFFQSAHPGGFKGADVFHYYMGSKYFGEVGYFDLYPCALAVLVERGLQDPAAIPPVRDQHSLRLQPREDTLAAMRRCPERFAPDRWREFGDDAAFFRKRVLGGSWTHLLEDHGYNPTPVWSFVGGLLSRTVPATESSFPRLIHLDRGLVLAMAALVAWAFGLEAACLALLVWGASPLWSYSWIGDAFLRNAWLFCAVAGLCLLERGRTAAAGALLAGSALLRLFPSVFLAGFLAHAAQRFRRDGVPPAVRRFALGAAVSAAVLLLGGALATGRGPGAYLEFRQKMAGVVAQPGVNKVGVSAFAAEIVDRARTREVTLSSGESVKLREPAPRVEALATGLRWMLVAAGLFAFWRALGRVTAAESALLSFALIPLITSPTNYYYPFVLCAAMLAPRRPWIGLGLSAVTLAWVAASQIWFLEDGRYLAYDVVVVIFSLGVLFGVAFTSPSASGAEAPTTA